MRRVGMMWGVVAALLATGPAWGEGGAMIGAGHEEMERARHELAGQVRGLGARFLGQFAVPPPSGGSPPHSVSQIGNHLLKEALDQLAQGFVFRERAEREPRLGCR